MVFASAAFAFAAVSASAGPVNVVPGGSNVAGKSIGQWTADWWNWVVSAPKPGDPLSDTSGANANVNQSGPVFFVAGTTTGGTAVTRSFQVPGDKYVLFPLLNVVVFNGPDPGFASTVAESKALVDNYNPSRLFATIDGTAVTDIASRRERSPDNFAVRPMANNVLGAPAQTFTDGSSDGYWVMLAPLGSGSHTIHFGGSHDAFTGPGGLFTDQAFSVDVTDQITVAGSSAVPLPTAVWPGLATLAALVCFGVVRGRRRGAPARQVA
jgi:hypothetical protein